MEEKEYVKRVSISLNNTFVLLQTYTKKALI
jgi:hypothetical protein